MRHDELVEYFSQSVGMEKASDLVERGVDAAGLDHSREYSDQEVIDICETIQQQTEGYVRTLAGEIRIQKRTEIYFQALLENIQDPAVVVTFENRSPVVSTVNDAFVTTFGYSREECLGEPLFDLIHLPETDEQLARRLWLQRTDSEQREVQRVTASGQQRTFLFNSSTVVHETGETEGYGIYTDITGRKRRQQELSLLKQVLSRVLRHNLRNDLGVIRGTTAMIPETDDHDTQQAYAEIVMEQVDDLIETCEKARQFERILDRPEAAQYDLDTVEVVTSAVEDAKDEYSDVDFVTDLPSSAPAIAHEELELAITDLIENAIVHNDADDPVVEVTVGEDDCSVWIEVTDNGPGIPEQEIRTLTQQRETDLTHGSGAGLWLVKWIVQKSNGDLEFETGQNGTTVRLRLQPVGR
jgi:PAS domain S-box-containing protein